MPAQPDASLAEQLVSVQAQRAVGRKRRFSRSRLDRYRAELEQLADHGASWADLAAWLRQYKRVRVHPTTVGRRLAHWRNPNA